jgi:hypothetical protein
LEFSGLLSKGCRFSIGDAIREQSIVVADGIVSLGLLWC